MAGATRPGSRPDSRQAVSGNLLLCLFNRHAPVGRRASWNGDTYISRCEHCDVPIFRLQKGKWRRDRRPRRDP